MSIIVNKEELVASNSLRKAALEILEAGLEAINTQKILKEKLSLDNGSCLRIAHLGFELSFYEKVFFIGIGKCAFDGATVIEEILGDKLTDGIVIDVKGGSLKKIRSYVGTHPYPSEVNISVTEQILNMVKGVTNKDLVLVLVSGGGSSLLCLPHSLSCETLINITRSLTEKGADIFELNTVRKHFSQVLGGGLAKILFPAQVVSLIFSDVLGNDLGMIASGPTVYDTTTVADAARVLLKYRILEEYISPECEFLETPKHPKYFDNIRNFLICSNNDALLAMKKQAELLGFKTEIESLTLSGNAREIGEKLASHQANPNSCFLAGGETTVEIHNPNGLGGRNQELILAALPYIKPDSVLVAVSSDGWDNTPHAGALADSFLLEKAKNLNLKINDFLDQNNSYLFFEKSGGAISTGRLGSNVSDLYIMLYK